MPIIQTRALRKTFRSVRRGEGLAGALGALFSREYEEKVAVDDVTISVEEIYADQTSPPGLNRHQFRHGSRVEGTTLTDGKARRRPERVRDNTAVAPDSPGHPTHDHKRLSHQRFINSFAASSRRSPGRFPATGSLVRHRS